MATIFDRFEKGKDGCYAIATEFAAKSWSEPDSFFKVDFAVLRYDLKQR